MSDGAGLAREDLVAEIDISNNEASRLVATTVSDGAELAREDHRSCRQFRMRVACFLSPVCLERIRKRLHGGLVATAGVERWRGA